MAWMTTVMFALYTTFQLDCPISFIFYIILLDDDDNVLMGMENLAVYTDQTQDPFITADGDDDDSEEEDDFNLLPTDNLIAVGHIEGDAAILEIHGDIFIDVI